LKKRTKKLLQIQAEPLRKGRSQLSKSFLLLFFKKEGLPAACLTYDRLPGQLQKKNQKTFANRLGLFPIGSAQHSTRVAGHTSAVGCNALWHCTTAWATKPVQREGGRRR
jgi:hypothetical protein